MIVCGDQLNITFNLINVSYNVWHNPKLSKWKAGSVSNNHVRHYLPRYNTYTLSVLNDLESVFLNK